MPQLFTVLVCALAMATALVDAQHHPTDETVVYRQGYRSRDCTGESMLPVTIPQKQCTPSVIQGAFHVMYTCIHFPSCVTVTDYNGFGCEWDKEIQSKTQPCNLCQGGGPFTSNFMYYCGTLRDAERTKYVELRSYDNALCNWSYGVTYAALPDFKCHDYTFCDFDGCYNQSVKVSSEGPCHKVQANYFTEKKRLFHKNIDCGYRQFSTLHHPGECLPTDDFAEASYTFRCIQQEEATRLSSALGADGKVAAEERLKRDNSHGPN